MAFGDDFGVGLDFVFEAPLWVAGWWAFFKCRGDEAAGL
jgi:hypothetical protein